MFEVELHIIEHEKRGPSASELRQTTIFLTCYKEKGAPLFSLTMQIF